MDVVDQSKDETTDVFRGNNNAARHPQHTISCSQ